MNCRCFNIIVVLVAAFLGNVVRGQASSITINCSPQAGFREKLAAKEIRRYVYLRTGELLSIIQTADKPESEAIVLRVDSSLDPQQYRLKTQGQTLTISGGTDIAVLYGAYDFAEKLGIRFYLHGDVIPDEKINFVIPKLDETHSPLFEKRGILPFHDFPEGPDWWSVDEWKTVIEQMTKMRMNFIGLHTYPKGALGPEPTVWIGLSQDCRQDGSVTVADSTSWHNTQRYASYGCYRPQKTSEFSCGGADVFPSDNYGPPINREHDFPFPKTAEQSCSMFGRAGQMLNDIFSYARRRGIITCVGTESPLNIPEVVQNRCKELGLDPTDPDTVRQLYEGMFTWIQRNYPIDYYWLWGFEGQIKEDAFKNDFLLAYKAAKNVNAPFKMGICGWGWIASNFPVLDKAFPKDVAFSCINMSVGREFLSPNLNRVKGREKWAIPWFEDDPALVTPQLYVGRMRKDAYDALHYECNGLMGLHWRTRVLSPNISALARAGWNQDGWSDLKTSDRTASKSLVRGGKMAVFLNHPIAGTDDDFVFQNVRYQMQAYELAVPEGSYNVTLQFCEPAYAAAGKRVFDVKLQGREVLSGLDVFAKAGQFRAFEASFDNIKSQNGKINITFVPRTESPCIAGIILQNTQHTLKINCGGEAYKDYQADIEQAKTSRSLPTKDFYLDWTRTQFGPDAGDEIADIFVSLDGHYPRPDNWNRGPGVITVSTQPFQPKKYDFVRYMERIEPKVKGAGNQERFAYWLGQFHYTEAMEKLGCLRGQLDLTMKQIGSEVDADRKKDLLVQAVNARKQMARTFETMYGYLFATLNNSSELGTIANIEQQSLLRTKLLTGHDQQLETLLGTSLPAEVHPRKEYAGPVRIVVPAKRGMRQVNEALDIKVIVLGHERIKTAELVYRTIGDTGIFQRRPLRHEARAVYTVTLPPLEKDVEYYIQISVSDGKLLRWPATAPEINQTVIVLLEKKE